MFEVAATDGTATLRAQLGAPGRQWLTASQDASKVFVTSASSAAYAVDSRNGGILWKQTSVVGGTVDASATAP